MTADTGPPAYTAQAVHDDGVLVDVALRWPARTWRLAGRSGAGAELDLARRALASPEALPVFIGTGLGHGVRRFLAESQRPLAVVDREEPVLALTGLRRELRGNPRVFWVDAPDPAAAVAALTRWQLAHQALPLLPLALPVYARLNQPLYGELVRRLAQSNRSDFWREARYAKFKSLPRKVLFLVRNDFLVATELIEALAELGVVCYPVNLSEYPDVSSFIEDFLKAVLLVKPDFVLTINHFGVDAAGALVDILSSLRLPLASWFIDNPEFILYRYDHLASPDIAVFTTAKGAVEPVKARGYAHVFPLPLAAATHRFRPVRPTLPQGHPWRAAVSFVGNTWIGEIAAKMRRGRFPGSLLRAYRAIGAFLERDPAVSPAQALRGHSPEAFARFENLGSLERQQDFEVMAIWEANRLRRLHAVERTLPFAPLIVGDATWKSLLRRVRSPWRWLERIDYYRDLPVFNPHSEINFNCTSIHMKGALNQRLFDVPATGAFLLTDYHPGLEEYFDLDREVACYRSLDEIPEALARYLQDLPGRRAVAAAGLKRIRAEHTYAHRVQTILATMERLFA